MKVLVTGGCGLVGYHLARHNKMIGNEVHVMDNLERSSLLGHDNVSNSRKKFNYNKLEEIGVKILEKDVSDPNVWNYIDSDYETIFHMAAQCGVPPSIANPRRDFEVNTVGTLNVLEHARQNNATVVYASTNKVYPIHSGFVKVNNRWNFENPQWAQVGFPVNNNLTGARTPYGNSKYAGDLLCQEYAHTYGVRTGVFRMSCIYGPNQFGFEEQGWATYFLIAARKGWPLTIYGDGDQVRDMLHVTDLVSAYMKYVKSDIHHGVWNIGGGDKFTLSLNEHLDWLRKNTDCSLNISHQDWRPLDQKCYVSDIFPVATALNWAPTISPTQGLQDVLEWVNDNISVF